MYQCVFTCVHVCVYLPISKSDARCGWPSFLPPGAVLNDPVDVNTHFKLELLLCACGRLALLALSLLLTAPGRLLWGQSHCGHTHTHIKHRVGGSETKTRGFLHNLGMERGGFFEKVLAPGPGGWRRMNGFTHSQETGQDIR